MSNQSRYQPMLTHAGVWVRDVERMKAFYTQVCNFVVSDEGLTSDGLPLCFLTGDPTKHHQFVLASGRPAAEKATTAFQYSFQLKTLADLRRAKRLAEENGATNMRPMNHGNAWAVYFDDPEGNNLEFYLDTPWYVTQPFGDPLDLSLSDEEIQRATEARCRSLPDFKTVAQWQQVTRERLAITEQPI